MTTAVGESPEPGEHVPGVDPKKAFPGMLGDARRAAAMTLRRDIVAMLRSSLGALYRFFLRDVTGAPLCCTSEKCKSEDAPRESDEG